MDTMRITVEQEGFCGLWHKADAEADSSKALIVIGGSEGNENIPMNVGKMFAARGISALGVCYFNVPGLPDNLIRVPVDPFEKAVRWLKNQGYEKVFIYGISKGGELALLAASLIPEISGVIGRRRCTAYGADWRETRDCWTKRSRTSRNSPGGERICPACRQSSNMHRESGT